jgi:transcription initiation factor IIE alpha subunit
VSEKFICPDCGNLVEVPDQSGDAARAVIESMDRELRMLRETVALLRGARAG